MKTFLMIWGFFLSANLSALQKVDMNKASKEQIALLPGIGEIQAEKILERRKKQIFKNTEDLEKVSGMNQKKIAGIEKLVTFSKEKIQVKQSSYENLKIYPMIPLHKLEERVLEHLNLGRSKEVDMHKRLRNSSWLPDLTTSFEMDKGTDDTEKKKPKKEESSQKRSIGYGFKVKATFSLGNLIFDDREIAFAKLLLDRNEDRMEIVAKVHESYFSYKNLIKEAESASSKEALEQIEEKMTQKAFFMDSLSNKAFSQHINSVKS